MEPKQKTNCIGGYSFLCIAVGIFMLLPATILTGLYAKTSDTNTAVALSLFSIALVLIIIGCVLCVIWCRRSGDDDGEKLAEEGEEAVEKGKEKEKTNGNAQSYARPTTPEDRLDSPGGEESYQFPGETKDGGLKGAQYGHLPPINRPKSVGATTMSGVAFTTNEESGNSSKPGSRISVRSGAEQTP